MICKIFYSDINNRMIKGTTYLIYKDMWNNIHTNIHRYIHTDRKTDKVFPMPVADAVMRR